MNPASRHALVTLKRLARGHPGASSGERGAFDILKNLEEGTPVDLADTLLRLDGYGRMNEAVDSLLPSSRGENRPNAVLAIGEGSEIGLTVLCDAWRGGVRARRARDDFRPANDGVLGGILGGGLGVAKAFFRAAGLEPDDDYESAGLSLWRLNSPWMAPASAGPKIEYLPKNLWLLGLGHLGQAYAWTLGLLPYEGAIRPTAFLQDYDLVGAENFTAGLLSEASAVDRKKTRVCSDWLEERGFTTSIVERSFGPDSKAHAGEPLVALAGFDSPVARSFLEEHGFLVVVDAGVGGNSANFDEIVLHTFPEAARSAKQTFWGAARPRASRIARHLLTEFEDKRCGFVVDEMTKTSASSSFVGTCTGALATAEILRGLHGGEAMDVLHWQLRGAGLPELCRKRQNLARPLAEAGYLPTVARRSTHGALLAGKI